MAKRDVNEGSGHRHGEAHQHAKLTDREVKVLRQLREDGMKIAVLAEKFEVSKGHVSKVCSFASRQAPSPRG